MKAQIPANEAERLRWLHEANVLYTPQEDTFDDITRLAAEVCKTPVAALSLIDEETQWFKSKYGIDASETPRDMSFCAHTITQRGMMVVGDAQHDARFTDNPYVTGPPHIRFYAGAPIVVSDDLAVGALCVIDSKPGRLNKQQQAVLEMLTRQVASRLEIRRQLELQRQLIAEKEHLLEERSRAQEELNAVVDQAMDGIFLFDPLSLRVIKSNQAFRQMLGYTEEQLSELTIYDLVAHDRESVEKNIGLLRQKSSVLGERNYRRRDGATIVGQVRGQVIRYGSGDAYCVSIHDISEHKQFETGQRFLVEAGGLLSASLDYETTLTSVARLAVPTLADLCFFDLLMGDSVPTRVAWAHRDPDKQKLLDATFWKHRGFIPAEGYNQHPVSRSFEQQDTIFVPEVTDRWMQESATGPEHLAMMRTLGLQSLMTVPLVERATTIGTLTLCFAESGRRYTAYHLNLAKELCSQAALAVQNARLYRSALDRSDLDPLTELFNHRAFHKKLQEETARAQREGTSLAVIMLDVDNFKFFNDVYGHLVGDELVKDIAGRLRAICRTYDTIARFGGDEFAIIMPGCSFATSAEVEDRVREDLSDISYHPDGHASPIPITLSIGAAIISNLSMSYHEALGVADERLMRCKTGGGVESEAYSIKNYALSHVQGFSMLDALVTAVDNKDRYTRRHSEDVLNYSLTIARQLGLDEDMQQDIGVAALIHDVGKIGVPDAILRKPGKLTDAEFEAMKQHPQMGFVMASTVPGLEGTLDAIHHHHERWDGGGYPFGLRGIETPLTARLMAVADAYSAMTTDRPYRQSIGHARAQKILDEGAGTQWDADCVRAFLSSVDSLLRARV